MLSRLPQSTRVVVVIEVAFDGKAFAKVLANKSIGLRVPPAASFSAKDVQFHVLGEDPLRSIFG